MIYKKKEKEPTYQVFIQPVFNFLRHIFKYST
jgi:hypothetical protein